MAVSLVVHDPALTKFRAYYALADPQPDGLSSVYEHIQASPANVWVLNHDLGSKLVEVVIFTAAGVRVYADPDYASASSNSIAVQFSEPLAGRAFVRSL